MAIKYTIYGLVQGIGFRPNVKRIAKDLGILGTVKNLGGIVEVLAMGDKESLNKFKNQILKIKMAEITEFYEEEIADFRTNSFEIVKSDITETQNPVISADIATCDRCITEFDDPENRRYLHPFISCTDCGPRYSVIDALPYDRVNITMSDFKMCDKCEREYTAISDCRCHAQTIACNVCGPRLSYTVSGEPLHEAARTLKSAGVVAIKDIGGYHFACLASSEKAAKKVRKIKNRDNKPFAVMFNNVDEIEEYAYVSDTETELLKSQARPIVLLKKLRDFTPSVCSQSSYIGAFLPCNSVQHYLTRECGPLVMTSSNVSGEPIIINNDEIFKLRKNADFEVLSHDRRILTPLDDSICRVICGKVQIIRRARGYVPMPIKISGRAKSVLATGGDLKAAFCLANANYAYMSQYFGDLESSDVYKAWKNNIKRMKSVLNINETAVISDLHPMYYSSKYADTSNRLQHHFSHMASVMAEHDISDKALGFIFDGTGYGTDKNIWGGEIILYDNGFKRLSHFSYTELLGGDSSQKNAEQICDCYLISAGLEPKSKEKSIIKSALENHINTVKSSSMGRLFDAVSSLLGICSYNSYEGECAIKLEMAAEKADTAYPLSLVYKDREWDIKLLIRDIYNAKETGEDINSIALGFHKAVSDAVCDYAKQAEIENIILSGGVFQNAILTEMCYNTLKELGFNVYFNEKVPANDGGIALGQVWYYLNRGE